MGATARFDKGMDTLRGRLLGLIEAVGLPDKQERAIKSTIKSLTYDLQAQVQEDIRTELERG